MLGKKRKHVISLEYDEKASKILNKSIYIYVCTLCGERWAFLSSAARFCPGVYCYSYSEKPFYLLTKQELHQLGIRETGPVAAVELRSYTSGKSVYIPLFDARALSPSKKTSPEGAALLAQIKEIGSSGGNL